jgi:iron(III) transport system substrate-binding protein
MRVTPVGILYNTELVKGPDVPKTFDDLLESKWQGQISMPDPSRHASTAQFLWNMEQLKGDKWMDFVRGLAKQKPHLVESYSSVPNTIVRGETAVGITYVQYAGQFKGPISFAPLDKVFADPSDVALSAKSPNANAGRLFIEYLCSAEGQKTVAGTGEFVLAPGIYPNIKGADKIMDSLVLMNDASSERLAKLQGEFRQLFVRK